MKNLITILALAMICWGAPQQGNYTVIQRVPDPKGHQDIIVLKHGNVRVKTECEGTWVEGSKQPTDSCWIAVGTILSLQRVGDSLLSKDGLTLIIKEESLSK